SRRQALKLCPGRQTMLKTLRLILTAACALFALKLPAGDAYLVKDLDPLGRFSSLSALVLVDDRIFFSGDDGIHGSELWVIDGTPPAPRLLADIKSGPQGSAPAELTARPGSADIP